ncbi:unnamed protein product [Linum tenue]|uniref:Uncharacterized protein n=1 Tax=Linum tenue TaxID=586396 RepID=A0AAV0IPZ5_9ROSI|nr:unnamed protein product [Linum tenue]
MAFFLKNSSLSSHFRSRSQEALSVPHRGFHVELGQREKALLADDPAIRRFKSHKSGVSKINKIGDFLTVVVVVGCCYEIYVKATMREESRKQAGESA